jgi:hypothetical protein
MIARGLGRFEKGMGTVRPWRRFSAFSREIVTHHVGASSGGTELLQGLSNGMLHASCGQVLRFVECFWPK